MMRGNHAAERPILFSGEMVRAIIAGRKTQTRRIIKGKDERFLDGFIGEGTLPEDEQSEFSQRIEKDGIRVWLTEYPEEGSEVLKCPYGQPGDRLWVRETFIDGWPCHDGDEPDQFDENGNENPRHVWYRADEKLVSQLGSSLQVWRKDSGEFTDSIPWKPSIHMPRWASRITLEITYIRIERLQDISWRDAKEEGAEISTLAKNFDGGTPEEDYITNFGNIWESINGKGSWGKNPWVWVIEFKRIKP